MVDSVFNPVAPNGPRQLTAKQLEAVQTLARHFCPKMREASAASGLALPGAYGSVGLHGAHGTSGPLDVTDFATKKFYVPETGAPIYLFPHQALILKLMFDPKCARYFGVANGFQTLVFSTIKKSGKTTLAALAARWVTEEWGNFNEVYSIANDKEQSRGRVYAKALQSIQLDPRWVRSTGQSGEIPGYWRVIERDATHVPSGSYMRAVSNDYKGEAGANPTATFWSELWGYTLEASRRLWDELTPVPTRPRSIRFVETYAGFENESTLLNQLYTKVTSEDAGAQPVTREDLANLGMEWPFPPDQDRVLPLYVNRNLRSFAYWDEDEPLGRSRRMPWQTRDYYAAQAGEMRPEVFDRLHRNKWVSSVSAFIPKEWWTACRPLPEDGIEPLTLNDPIVVAIDASVSGDCTAMVAVSRHPIRRSDTVARLARSWTPPAHGKMDYGAPEGLKETLKEWIRKYNVVQVAYDPYQLHDVMTELRQTDDVWAREFSQGDERMIADFGLYTDIRDRRIVDDTQSPELLEHLQNAGARIPKDSNTKLRIVKKSEDKKIDLAVCLSMARAECKRLMLD